MPRLVLIDANSLIHRAFHALPDSIRTGDQPTNAAYGFTRMIIKIIKDLEPNYIALLFDAKGPTFRHEIDEAYKETRPEAPEELKSQFPIVQEIMDAFDIATFSKEGFEADDLIATLLESFKDQNLETIVVTGDRDLFQLVDDKNMIEVYMPVKGVTQMKMFKEADVEKKMGVPPSQVVDYKALRGDPSDNIPGVQGVGKKTAGALLKKFPDLNTLYKNLDEVESERVRGLLEKDRDAAKISKDLVELKHNVPVSLTLKNLVLDIEKDKVLDVFEKYKFNSLIKQLDLEEENSDQLQLV